MIDGVSLLRSSSCWVIGINGVVRSGCAVSVVEGVYRVKSFCCRRGWVSAGVVGY